MRLSWPEIRTNAAFFSEKWQAAHYEKGQTHSFYDDFFEVFGVPRTQVATYEQRVKALDPKRSDGFIDLFWPGTLIIEQKSAGKSLFRAMDQALNYYDWLPEAQRPRYMMVSDFQRFELVDLQTRQEWRFPLADLKRHVEAFGFILGVQPRLFRNQSPANAKASQLMGRLHQALEDDGYVGHNLERLLVRLLFILFADDTGIFERKDQFLTFLEQRTSPDGRDLGRWLGELFQTLDTPIDRRQSGLDADLAEFPYINGNLFAERIDLPSFNNVMRDMLLDASMFNWGEVSPAIFGSLFESVIDKVTRRRQGAHYTPEEAILKVIGPLFLDALTIEFKRIKSLRSNRRNSLIKFQERLSNLTFFDPACGAGNFLVVAYREIRELERELIKELNTIEGTIQKVTDVSLLSMLNVDRFFGIEIDEFPALIAQVALWMTDHIANTRLAEDFGQAWARIPLVTAPGIHHCDALALDWNDVLPADRCAFILGNPPFVGAKMQTEEQRRQVRQLANLPGSGGTLDYVAAWFVKAARYVQQGDTKIGFVSTNSITQGEQVAQLWPILFREGLEIAFAHRTFVWPGRAAVHCVVIGLVKRSDELPEKRLFTYADPTGNPSETKHAALTAYLFDANGADRHQVVKLESSPINGANRIIIGSKPIDGGYLIFNAAERAALLQSEPNSEKFLRPYIGADEYLNGGSRWILALQNARPDELRTLSVIKSRLKQVTAYRRGEILARGKTLSEIKTPGTSATLLADVPAAFHVTVIPDRPFMVIPEVSSERRDYLPIGWLEPPIIPSNKLRILGEASLWQFGILTSRMHMSWTRHVGGRLKSDYQYSIGLNYNTYPWPKANSNQMSQVADLAKLVLEARNLPKNTTSTLADLYDPDTMPFELRAAHRNLDLAVDRLYRRKPFVSDQERVEMLFVLYQRMIDPLQNEGIRQNDLVNRRSRR